MIDIPLNKALASAEYRDKTETDEARCNKYCFLNSEAFDCTEICCNDFERKDGKNVIFKLVDLPGEARNVLSKLR